MKKCKVLIFTIAETKGGHTQYSMNNFRRINHEIIKMDFVTFSKSISLENEIASGGGCVYYLSCHPEKDMNKFRCEFVSVLKNGYDVIHIHTSYWVDTIVEKIAKECGVKKIIVHAHSTGLGNTLPEKRNEVFEKHMVIRESINDDLATDYWACSNEAADWLFGNSISKSKIKIIKNSIDTKKYAYNENVRSIMRDSYNVTNKYVVGFVGRLEQPKNIEFIYELYKNVNAICKDIFFIIVGDGSKRQYIESMLERDKISDNILVTGYQENICDWLQAFDVFILPSLFEGFPISLLEAQASGLKCLSSKAMTSEINFFNNIKMLDLKIDLWINEILELQKGYERKSMSQEILNRGYDSIEQARTLEEYYLEGI